jgi:nitrogen fixation protein NifU and related proteins
VSEDRLLDYFESRTYRGSVAGESARVGHRHPACGDEVVLSVRVEAGVLRAIRFDARGCVVSQAAAAMLCEHLEGRSLAEINAFSARDMLDLVALPLSPRRLACALLPYEALRLLEPFAAPPTPSPH